MNFKVGVTLLFLCGLIIFHIGDCKICDLNSTSGDSVNIPLELSTLDSQKDDIKWKFKGKIIFRKRNGVNWSGNTGKVNDKLELVIHDVKRDAEGEYTVEVFGDNGASKLSKKIQLCVYDRPSKPVLNFTCNKGLADLRCEAKENKDQSFIWYQNGKRSENKNFLIGKKDGSYECALELLGKSYKSDTVETNCVKLAQGDKLFGFDFWIMVGILAGGGGLVLLLVIVLVTCACQSCKRREKHLRDEEELRLNFHTPPQRSKNTARGQPAPPVPQEDPEVSNYEVDEPPPKAQSKVKNQPRIRPPPPPIDEDEQPPPLPQPRSKVPHNKKNQGPLYMQP